MLICKITSAPGTLIAVDATVVVVPEATDRRIMTNNEMSAFFE